MTHAQPPPHTDIPQDPEAIWIPGGWLDAGGDPAALNALPAQRWWIEGFWIQRDPVTFQEYFVFLNALDPTQAAPRAPILRPWIDAEVLFSHLANRWQLAGANPPPTDAPVVGISWWDAIAYAQWRTACDGCAWRLPTELEWERAARGPAHFCYPWGNTFDPAQCRMVLTQPGPPGLVSVHTHPQDTSAWGVRGLGGNSADWCLDTYRYEGPLTKGPSAPVPTLEDAIQQGREAARVYRGGAWLYSEDLCRAARRGLNVPEYRGAHLGVRLARS